jgi:hypothetical protein
MMLFVRLCSSAPAGKATAQEKYKFNMSLTPKAGKGIDR